MSAQRAAAAQANGAPLTRAQRVRTALWLALAVVISVAVLLATTYFRDELLAIGRVGLVGLLVLSIVGNATVLIPAPVFVVACAAGPLYGALAVGVVAGLGSALGEMTGYMAGYGGTAILPQGKVYRRLRWLMRRYGALVLFLLSAVPNPFFDVGGLLAGVLKMPPPVFLLATAAGKAVRLGLTAFACTQGLPLLLHLFTTN
ncbi:MAG: VTT domain-containing protein [Thermoflexales bacterium]|nr:VTT domain-containing protein [Thermoflexales bacterium]